MATPVLTAQQRRLAGSVGGGCRQPRAGDALRPFTSAWFLNGYRCGTLKRMDEGVRERIGRWVSVTIGLVALGAALTLLISNYSAFWEGVTDRSARVSDRLTDFNVARLAAGSGPRAPGRRLTNR
jgi:hypothetical protein